MPENGNIFLIKDLARSAGTSVYTIKYYLKLGLLQEAGRTPETNFRLFDPSSIQRLHQIRAYQKEGLSLRQIAQKLNSHNGSEISR